MENKTRSYLLGLFSIIWICKPISYQEVAYPKYNHQQIVVSVNRGGGSPQSTQSSVSGARGGFTAPSTGKTNSGSPKSSSSDPKQPFRAASGDGPGSSGGGNLDDTTVDKNKVPRESKWETTQAYWNKYSPQANCDVDESDSDEDSQDPANAKTVTLDELAKPDLPLEAKQKLLENPQLLELSIDPRNSQIDKQSFDEAESIMQTLRETGLFDDARRPDSAKGERDIDFIVSGSLYDEVDIKTPKSFFDTRKGPKTPIPQDMLDYLAKESGAKSILQKQGSESCLHILDLKDMQSHQKESYKANFLQGAREADPELAKHIIVQND